MCCFSCTPKGGRLLDAKRMKEYMDQASDIKTVKNIAFSGGEAIMHFRQFLDCVSYAAGLGFNATLVTNGFWAADEKKGYRMMNTLAEAGLKQVSISVDTYHQEFVPIETERKAARILAELGLLSALTFMDTKDGACMGNSLDELRPEIYGAELILYPLFEAGAAGKNIPGDQYLRLCEARAAACPYEKDIAVLFDGSVMMCCSQYSHVIPMTHLGDFYENSLQETITAFNQNDFIYILLHSGFEWYVNAAEELGYTFNSHYGVACELCHAIFSNAELTEKLKPAVKREADRLRLSKLFGKTI
jgi:TPR repeat protein